jgi:hypothetical protein
MSDDIVGIIEPGDDGGAATFRIIRRIGGARGEQHELGSDDAGVRPCAHPRFILDERWSTVTCGECKQVVDAFSALMRYAEWSEQWRRDRGLAEAAEQRLQITVLRSLARKRCFTDEERRELNGAIQNYRPHRTARELEVIVRKFEALERDRRSEKRQARSTPRRA